MKHVKSKGLWPPDPFFNDEESSTGGRDTTGDDGQKEESHPRDEGGEDGGEP